MNGHPIHVIGWLSPSTTQSALKLTNTLLERSIVAGYSHTMDIVDM